MAINKVVYGNTTLVDLTEDTATEEDVMEGKTFHDASGQKRTGSATQGGRVQDVEVNGESVVNTEGVAEVVVPVSGDVSTTDSFESYTGGKVKSLQMELSPIQDLHGYPNPWVGGTGRNVVVLDLDTIKARNTSGTWNGDVYTFNGVSWSFTTDNGGNITEVVANNQATADSTLIIPIANNRLIAGVAYFYNGCPSGGTSSTYRDFVRGGGYDYGSGNQITPTQENIDNNYYDFRMVVLNGYNAQNLKFKPLMQLSSLTDRTFAPYSNKCPISAHIQAKLEQRGKNWLDNKISMPYTRNGVTFTQNADGSIEANGTASGGNAILVLWNRNTNNQHLPSGDYTLSGCPANGSSSTYYMQMQATRNGNLYEFGTDKGTGITGAVLDTDVMQITCLVVNGYTANHLKFYPQLELGSSATDYEPYQGKDYIINLGGSYYWIKGDVVTGKWYVVGKDTTYDGSTDENWNKISGENRYSVAKPSDINADPDGSISNEFKYFGTSGASVPDGQFYVGGSNIGVRLNSITTLADWKTFLSNNPMTVVYPLATPIPINLDPQLIEEFVGENNFSAPLEQQEIIKIVARNIAEFNEVIDDENISDEFTYSSEKIEDRLDEYVDKDAVDVKSATTEFETINGGLLSECKVTLEPTQNLHGFSEPWVGEAGKNKCEQTVDKIKSLNTEGTWSGNSYTWRGITYTILTDDANNIIGYDVDGTATERGWLFISDTNLGNSDATYNGNNVNGYIYTSDNPNFEVGTYHCWYSPSQIRSYILVDVGLTKNHDKWYPMARLNTVDDPTFEPYTNICPITGHTEAKILDDGKNRLEDTFNTGTLLGVDITAENGVIDLNGTGTGNNNFAIKSRTLSGEYIYHPKGNYIFSAQGIGSGVVVGTTYNGAFYEIARNDGGESVGFSITDNTPSDYKQSDGSVLLALYINIKQTTYNHQKVYPMIRLASDTDPTFAPYNNYQVTVNLGGIYYSGVLDVVRGVMTVDMASVDLGTLTWSYNGERFASSISGITLENTRRKGICSHYTVFNGSVVNAPDRSLIFNNSNTTIYIKDSWYSDVETFMTVVTGIQVVYKLNTPLTIQLSPTMVKALVGENHLSAPLEGQEIDEVKYKEAFDFNDVMKVANYFTLPLQIFTFTNKICNVNDSRITSDSLVDVYFTSDSMSSVEDAGITVESQNGKIVMTAEEQPVGTIQGRIKVVN